MLSPGLPLLYKVILSEALKALLNKVTSSKANDLPILYPLFIGVEVSLPSLPIAFTKVLVDSPNVKVPVPIELLLKKTSKLFPSLTNNKL